MFFSTPIFKEYSLIKGAGKRLTPKKYFFQEITPLASRSFVRGDKDKLDRTCCMGELQAMFNCLKKWEFDDLNCKAQHETYLRCVEVHAKRVAEFNAASKKGILGQGDSALTKSQINRLMELYPQPNLGKFPSKHMKRLPTQSYADDIFRRKHLRGKAS